VSYMVIFRTSEGKPGYQQAEEVQDAVAAVERLRNDDGVDNVRIFRMEEVAFEYKVHYSVRLADGSSPAPVGAGAAGGSDELSWDDESESATAPFDQMAVDPGGAPRWDESTESTDDGPAPIDEPESDASDTDARRGLFGR
jgi:hypothetical protein